MCTRVDDGAPAIVDPEADRSFRALASRLRLDPDARFVGGYVGWEWAHARHVFEGLVAPVRGEPVLEVGCNMGATAIVLAALGAEVTAVDPNPAYLDLARANAARYGLSSRIAFVHVADTTRMPLERARFSWVSCNSVLEYVPPAALAGVLAEIDRVLRPGGLVAVLGTSNRLWPREGHSGRWLVNYVPRRLDFLLRPAPGARVARGITARGIRAVLRDYEDRTQADGGRLYVAMKARMGVSGGKLLALAVASRALASIGVSPGAVAPTMTLLLQKRP
jgi:SAM-dependent methyltransferase